MGYKIVDEETGKEVVLSQNKITGAQAWGFVGNQAKNLVVLLPILTLIGSMVLATYGEPFVKAIVKKETDTIVKEVKKNTKQSKLNGFSISQILLILEMTTDSSVVEEVKKKTARFKPE